MDWLWNSAWHFLVNGLAGLPGWLLLVVAAGLLGVAFKIMGWQGVLGMALGLLTLGAYRQGWKDHGDNKPPFVPVEVKAPDPPIPKRKPKTLLDLLKLRN
jgi:hypothetical protein